MRIKIFRDENRSRHFWPGRGRQGSSLVSRPRDGGVSLPAVGRFCFRPYHPLHILIPRLWVRADSDQLTDGLGVLCEQWSLAVMCPAFLCGPTDPGWVSSIWLTIFSTWRTISDMRLSFASRIIAISFATLCSPRASVRPNSVKCPHIDG